MFIEQRIYTLKPRKLQSFWDLQQDRGFDIVRPIIDRLVGYFGRAGDESDEVVHLYRYDSHADWVTRLHGLYGRPELDSYFKSVRALMKRQDNTILAPAALPWLNPLLGAGNDWLPKDGPRFGPGAVPAAIRIETVDFRPGALPGFWAALEEEKGSAIDKGLVGVFVTIIGRQHRLIIYRTAGEPAANERWQAVLGAARDTIAAIGTGEFQIAPHPAMTPLFTPLAASPDDGEKLARNARR